MTEQPKQYLIAHIREALAEDPRVNELDVDVAVAGGTVFVTGRVTTAQRKEAISEVLGERFPEQDIANEITVAMPEPPGEAEAIA